MSTFNQGSPGVPTVFSTSNCIVYGNTSSGTALTIQQLGAGNVLVLSNTSGPQMVMTSTGNVGIGTNLPNASLQVSGTANISSLNLSNLVVGGSIGTFGQILQATGTGLQWTSTSTSTTQPEYITVANWVSNTTTDSSVFSLPAPVGYVGTPLIPYGIPGGSGTTQGTASVLASTADTGSNLYLTGTYLAPPTMFLGVNVCSFANTTSNLTSYYLPTQSANAIFIIKYSPLGSPLLFTAMSGTGACQGQAISLDSGSNVIVSGYYTSTGTVSINNLALNNTLQASTYTLPSASAGGFFILKYNSTGTLVSFTAFSGSGLCAGTGLAIDVGSNTYVSGYYTSTTPLALSNLALTSSLQSASMFFPITATSAPFLLKFSPTGNVVNYTTLLNTTAASQGLAVTVEPGSNVYFTGYYNSSGAPLISNLAVYNYSFPSSSTAASYIVKYSPTSAIQASTSLIGTGACQGQAVTYDAGSNIYVTGYYTTTGTSAVNLLTYNSISQSSGYTLPAASAQGAYIVKYSPSGSPLLFTAITGTGACQGLGLSLDAGSNLYVTGSYISTGTVQVSNLALNSGLVNSGFTLPAATNGGAFLLKYSALTGNITSFTSFFGTGLFTGTGLACDAGSNVLMSGYYVNTNTTLLANLALNSTLQFTPYVFPISTVQNPFLVRFSPGGTIVNYTTLPSSAASQGLAVANTVSSNVYFTGYYNSTGNVFVNPMTTAVSLPAAAAGGSMTTKYSLTNTSNALALTNLVGTGACQGQAIAYDSGSNIYVTGYYTSTGTSNVALMAYNSNVINSGYTLPAASAQGAYIVKYSPSGSPLLFTAITGTGACQGLGLSLDAGSNLYVTGSYISTGTVQVSNLALNSGLVNSGFTFPAASAGGAFLLKYSALTGNITSFTSFFGTGLFTGTGLACDAGSNVLMSGYYVNTNTTLLANLALNSTLQFTPYVFPISTVQNPFLVRFSPGGTIVNYTTLPSSAASQGLSVANTVSSNVYFTGYYNSAANVFVNPMTTAVSLPASSGLGSMTTKYSFKNTSNALALTNLVGTGACQGQAVTYDSGSNIYVTGYYTSTGTSNVALMAYNSNVINSGYTLPAASAQGAYIVKYSPTGTPLLFTAITGTGACQGLGLSLDAGSNLYVTGSYISSGTVQVSNLALNSGLVNSGFTFPAASAGGAFVLKYSALTGNITSFTSFSGSGLFAGTGLACDAGSNVFLTGYYTSTYTPYIFSLGNPSPVAAYIFPISSVSSPYLVRFAPNGNVINYTTLTVTAASQGLATATTPYGNVYISGYYNSSSLVPISPMTTSIALPPSASAGAYINKYSLKLTTGPLATSNLVGTGACQGQAVTYDAGSNIYVTGYYTSTGTSNVTLVNYSSNVINSGYTLPGTVGQNGVYIVKYSPSGSPLLFTTLLGSGACQGLGLSLDAGSNLYVTGYYTSTGTVAVSNLALSSTMVNSGFTLAAAPAGGAFLLKYSAFTGNTISFTGFSGSGLCVGTALTCDAISNVVMSGYYISTWNPYLYNMALSSAPLPTTVLPTTSVQNPFLIRFSSNGNILNYTTLVASAASQGLAVANTLVSNIYFTGYYNSGSVVPLNRLSSLTMLPTSSSQTSFITKYNSNTPFLAPATSNLFGTGACQGQAITYDAGSNIYVTGYYTSTGTSNVALVNYSANVINSGYTLPAATAQGAYIVKYSPSGSPLLFTAITGTGACQGLGLSLDAGSNLYVTGSYISSGTVQVSNLALNSGLVNSGFTLPAATNGGAFLLKYSALTGNITSFTSFFGTGLFTGTGLACDAGSNVLMSGYYVSTNTTPLPNMALTSSLVPGPYLLPATSVQNPFLVRFSPGGTIVNYTTLPCSVASQGSAVANTVSSNVYFTGYYNSGSAVPVYPMTTAVGLPATGAVAGSMTTKYSLTNTSNALALTNLVGTGACQGQAVTYDSGSNIYVTGYYTSTGTSNVALMAYNSNVINSGYTLPAASAQGAYIVKYSPTGTPLLFTGITGTGACQGLGLSLDAGSNLYVTGSYISSGTVQVSNLALNSGLVNSGFTFPAASAGGAFVLKYSALTGNITSFTSFSGSGLFAGTGLTCDAGSNVLVSGYYVNTNTTFLANLALNSTLQFSPYVFPIASVQNPFLVRFSPNGTIINYTTLPCSVASQGSAVANTVSSNVYFTGYYNSTGNVFVNPMATTVSLPTASGTTTSFVSKYTLQNSLNAPSTSNISGSGTCQGQAIAYDAGANIYVTGYYTSTGASNVTLMNYNSNIIYSGYTLPSSVIPSVYIIKYSPSGVPLLFTNFVGSGPSQGLSISVDSGSNLYVTGNYISSSAISISNLAQNSTMQASGLTLPSVTASGTFLLKYSAVTGNIISFTGLTGSGQCSGMGVQCDAGSNVLLTGFYTSSWTPLLYTLSLNSTLQYSGFSFPASTSTTQNPYTMRFSPSGSILNYTTLPCTGSSIGISVASTPTSNIYYTGYYNSSSIIPLYPMGTSLLLPSSSAAGTFITKTSLITTSNSTAVSNIVGTGACQGQAVTYDAGSNIYVTGYYTSTGTSNVSLMTYSSNVINSGYTLPAASAQGAYIVKYSPTGSPLLFTALTGTGACQGLGISVDAGSNLYVTGSYISSGTVQVSNLALNSSLVNSGFTLPAASVAAVFVLKYSAASGNIVSFTNLTGTSASAGTGLACDAGSNAHVVGYYLNSGTSTVNNLALNSTPQSSGFTLPASTQNAAFIIKYAPSGSAFSFTNLTGSGSCRGLAVATTTSNIYFTGFYTNSGTSVVSNLALNSTMLSSGQTLPAASATGLFFVNYQLNGNVYSFTNLTGTGACQGQGLAVDGLSNVYLTGYYTSTVPVPVNNLAFNSTPQNSVMALPVSTPNSMFTLKYSNIGSLVALTNMTGSSTVQGLGVTTDVNSNVLLCGYYNTSGTIAVNNFIGQNVLSYTSNTNSTGFVATYQSSNLNNVISATNFSSTGACNVNGVYTDAGSNVYVTGYYTSSGTSSVNLMTYTSTPAASGYTLSSSSGQNAMFIAKYSPSGSPLMFTNLIGTGACAGQSVTVDAGSNVYVSGYYTSTGTVALNNIVLNSTPAPTAYTLPASATQSMFVTCYNQSGNLLRFTAFGLGTGTPNGAYIQCDAGSNVYVSSQLGGTTTGAIYNIALGVSLSSSGFTVTTALQVCILKFSPAGSFISYGGQSTGYNTGTTATWLAIDAGSNVFVSGCGGSFSIYYFGTGTLTAAGGAGSSGALGVGSLVMKLPQPLTSGATSVYAYSTGTNIVSYSGPVVTDAGSNVWISGSSSCPALGSYQMYSQFIAKMSPNNTLLAYTVIPSTWNFGLASDAGSNVYILTTYNSTATTPIPLFTNSSGYVNSPFVVQPGSGMLVVKYDTSGNVLSGTTLVSGSFYNTCGNHGIVVDAGSNVIIGGNYSTSGVMFNLPFSSAATMMSSASQNAGYIFGYTPSGQVIYETNFNGSGTSICYGVTIDAGSNIVTTGTYTSTSNLILASNQRATSFLPPYPSQNMFTCGYDTFGRVNFSTVLQGTNYQNTSGNAIVVDQGSNVYITGYTTSSAPTIIFNSGSYVASGYQLPSTSGIIGQYLLKYSNTGSVLSFTNLLGSGTCQGAGLSTDSGSNAYMTGYYTSTFGGVVSNLALNNTLQTYGNVLPVSTVGSLVTLGFSPSGNVIYYTSGIGTCQGIGVTVDLGSNIYTTGTYSGTSNVILLPFFNKPSFTLPSSAQNAVFLTEYAPSGAVLGLTNLTGSGACQGQGLAVDGLSNVYLTGYYTNTGTSNVNNLTLLSNPVAQSSGFTLPVSSVNAPFIIKYSNTGSALLFTNLSGSVASQGLAVATDAGSNVFVGGFYNSASGVTINQLALNSTMQPSGNIFPLNAQNTGFMVGYGPTGSVIALTNQIGTGAGRYAGLVVDPGSNIYTTGSYTSTSNVLLSNLVPFSAAGTGFNLPSSAQNAVFLTEYAPSGAVLGLTNLTGSGACQGQGLAVDGLSNVYLTGYYTNTGTSAVNNLALNSTPQSSGFTLPVSSVNAPFIIKYSNTGSALSFTNLVGTNNGLAYGIATDAGSNVYYGGYYNSTAVVAINNLALNSAVQPSGNTFVGYNQNVPYFVRYSPSGSVLGFANFASPTGASVLRGVTVDPGSNIYTTGSYISTSNVLLSNLVPLNLFGNTLPSSGQNAMFIAQYDPSGNITSYTNFSGSAACAGTGLAIDGLSNVYLSGYYTTTGTGVVNNLAFNPTPQSSGFSLPTSSVNSPFLIKYSNTGSVLLFTGFTGTAASQGLGVATDTGSNVFMTGYYNSTGSITINKMALNSVFQSSGNAYAASSVNANYMLVYDPTGNLVAYTNFIGSGASPGLAVTVDPGSNIYTTGSYIATSNVILSNLVPFSAQYTLPSSAQNAVYLLEYGPSGAVLGLTNLTGSGACQGQGLAVDGLSNVYLTGYYTNTGTSAVNNLALNSTPQSSGFTLPVSSVNAPFIIKYSNTGSALLFTNLSGSVASQGLAVTTDAGSNVFYGGYYNSASGVTINQLALNSTMQSSGNIFPLNAQNTGFMVGYGPTGSVIALTNQIGTGAGRYAGLVVDPGSNIYTTGSYTSTSNVLLSNLVPFSAAGTGFNLPSSTQNTVYLVEYGPSGAVLGLTNLTGSGACQGQGLAVDGLSNVYLTGYYTNTGTSNINNLTLLSNPVAQSSGFTLPVSSVNAPFIIKYSNTGSALSFTNLSGSVASQALGATTDAGSNVFFTGFYNSASSVTINQLALNSTMQPSGNSFFSSTTNAQFLLGYTPTGSLITYGSFAGSGACSGRGIAADASANIFVTGSYISTSSISPRSVPLPIYTIPLSTQNAVFLLKYAPSGNIISYTNLTGSGACQGTALTLDGLSNVYLTGSYTNSGASTVNNLALNSTPQSSGFTLSAAPNAGMFVIRYSNVGTMTSYTNLAGTGACVGLGLATDTSSNVFVCGYYTSASNVVVNTLRTAPTAYANLYTSIYNAPFVVSYTPSGTVSSYSCVPLAGIQGTVSGTTPLTFQSYLQTVTTDAGSNVYSFGQMPGTQLVNNGNTFPLYSSANVTPYNYTLINPYTSTAQGNLPTSFAAAAAAFKFSPSGVVAPPIQVTLQTPASPLLISVKKLYNTGGTPLQIYVNGTQTSISLKQTWEWVNTRWFLTQTQ